MKRLIAGCVLSFSLGGVGLVFAHDAHAEESFVVEKPQVSGPSVDEKRDEVMSQCIEQYEQFVHLCTRLTQEIASAQDVQLKKMHKLLAQGDSLSVKKMEGMLVQFKKQVQSLEHCVAQVVKG